jgi:hypothetical protein
MMSYLCDIGYVVSIETNGHLPVGDVDHESSESNGFQMPGIGIWLNSIILKM